MFLLTLGFLFERYNINWLTNRSGLTYNKLQKVIELEIRRVEIKARDTNEQWKKRPRYSPELYRDNYFGKDIDELMERF
jgi:hypothetical protein